MRPSRLAILVLALAALAATPAAAGPGLPSWLPPVPEITRLEWADPPVTTAGPGCEDPCSAEVLIIEARDLDSSISEVMVELGEGQPVLLASTGCVQGIEPGRPAVLRIGAGYLEPGTYTVRVQVRSELACNSLAPHQESRIATLETVVTAAG